MKVLNPIKKAWRAYCDFATASTFSPSYLLPTINMVLVQQAEAEAPARRNEAEARRLFASRSPTPYEFVQIIEKRVNARFLAPKPREGEMITSFMERLAQAFEDWVNAQRPHDPRHG